MKFCTQCGNQMFDDAVICTKCGKLDESFPYNNIQPQINRSQAPKMAKESVIASIFSFISSILSAYSISRAKIVKITKNSQEKTT